MSTTVIRNSDWIVAHEGGGHLYARGDVAFTANALTHVGGTYTGAADTQGADGAHAGEFLAARPHDI